MMNLTLAATKKLATCIYHIPALQTWVDIRPDLPPDRPPPHHS